MNNEEFKLKLLKKFGYTPKDLDCSDVSAAFKKTFDIDWNSDPSEFLLGFIENCQIKDFIQLKFTLFTEIKKNE